MSTWDSNSNNFIIKEVHEVIATQVYGDTWFNRAVTLCQPGYSAEEEPRVVLMFFYQC